MIPESQAALCAPSPRPIGQWSAAAPDDPLPPAPLSRLRVARLPPVEVKRDHLDRSHTKNRFFTIQKHDKHEFEVNTVLYYCTCEFVVISMASCTLFMSESRVRWSTGSTLCTSMFVMTSRFSGNMKFSRTYNKISVICMRVCLVSDLQLQIAYSIMIINALCFSRRSQTQKNG